MTQKNPYFTDPENYFDAYNKSIEALKNHPENVAFDKLCYELFACSEQGKKFISHVEKQYLIPALANPNSPNYETMCIYMEGFKNGFRVIRQAVMSHEQRIKAGEENK